MSAQKGPFGLKQTQTGRKAPERPTTPQECPKHHKTLWLVGYHWYDILSRTLRPFGYPSGAHWDRICPKTSLLVLIDDPMVATKDRKESKNFANYLSGLAPLMWSRAACFHTILAFPGTRCSLHKGLFCPPNPPLEAPFLVGCCFGWNICICHNGKLWSIDAITMHIEPSSWRKRPN